MKDNLNIKIYNYIILFIIIHNCTKNSFFIRYLYNTIYKIYKNTVKI